MYGSDSSDDDDDDDDDDDNDNDYHGIATTTTTAAAVFSRTTATTRTAATIAAAAAAPAAPAVSANDKRIRKFTKTKKTQTTKKKTKKKRRMKKNWKDPTNNIFVNELTSSSTTLLMKKIGLLGFVLLVFLANFIILSVYLPSPSDSSKLRINSICSSSRRRSFTSSDKYTAGSGPSASTDNYKNKNNNNNKNKNKNMPFCGGGDDDGVHPISSSPYWGCTIFPPEYTSDYNSTMRSKSATVDSSSSPSSSSFSDYTFASLTEQGKSHAINQDRGFVVTNFMNVLANGDNENNNANAINIHSQNSFVMGVFDGHGQYGHNVSQRCVETFPKLLYDKLFPLLDKVQQQQQQQQDKSIARTATTTTTTIKKILNETFWELDRQGTSPEYYMGGTTATVALRLRLGQEDKLYVANTGDSQTIVVQCTAANLGGGRAGNNSNNNDNNNVNVKAEVVYKSIKDKPNLADEHDRILGRGGVIGPNGGRVIVHTKAVQKDIIGLAMSRSIGDWEWGDVGVIPEPRVDVIDLKPYYQEMTSTSKLKDGTTKTTSTTTASTLFVMSASDGIWDRRPRPDFFARQFCPTFVGGDEMVMNMSIGTRTSKNIVLQRKLMDVMDLVTPTVGYQDDMTAVIMKLDL